MRLVKALNGPLLEFQGFPVRFLVEVRVRPPEKLLCLPEVSLLAVQLERFGHWCSNGLIGSLWYDTGMASNKSKTTVIVPDVQWPFHDGLALKKILKVIEDVQPHQVVQIGDGIDFPQVSQWSVGTAGAYADDLQSHVQGYREGFLRQVAERAPKARLRWLEGNHDLRVMSFIKKYAPALASLDALSMPNLFSLDSMGWTYERGPINIGTNVYAIHGHECGGYSATLNAWDAKFTKRYGSHRSYVFGHTHQPGIITRAYGFE